jgi:hypothetical protein
MNKLDVLAVGGLALLLAAAVAAQPPADCRQDLQKLCNGIRPGGGRLIACLLSKQAELSPPCQKALASVTPRPAEPARHTRRAACSADLEKFCRDAPQRQGGGFACLRQHKDELSDVCKAALAK